MSGLSHITPLLYSEISGNFLPHSKGQNLYSSLQSLRLLKPTLNSLISIPTILPISNFTFGHTGLPVYIKYSGKFLPPDFCTSRFLCLEFFLQIKILLILISFRTCLKCILLTTLFKRNCLTGLSSLFFTAVFPILRTLYSGAQ